MIARICAIARSSIARPSWRVLRNTEVGILFNEHVAEDGPIVFAHACRLGAEGIVSKAVGPHISIRPVPRLDQGPQPSKCRCAASSQHELERVNTHLLSAPIATPPSRILPGGKPEVWHQLARSSPCPLQQAVSLYLGTPAAKPTSSELQLRTHRGQVSSSSPVQ
jgi:hypothetical protein